MGRRSNPDLWDRVEQLIGKRLGALDKLRKRRRPEAGVEVESVEVVEHQHLVAAPTPKSATERQLSVSGSQGPFGGAVMEIRLDLRPPDSLAVGIGNPPKHPPFRVHTDTDRSIGEEP